MSQTSTINRAVHATGVTDSYIQWESRYNQAIANNDSTAALSIVKEGIQFASLGESVADMTFDLIEKFGAFWSDAELRRVLSDLGKSGSTTALYTTIAEVITIPGVTRKDGESWTQIRAAVNTVKRTDASLVKLITARVKAFVRVRRDKNAEAVVSFTAVSKEIDQIAKDAKERRVVSPQDKAMTTLKTMRTNAELMRVSIQNGDVDKTDAILLFIKETYNILGEILA